MQGTYETKFPLTFAICNTKKVLKGDMDLNVLEF